jgi:hypothetical protein
MSLSVDSEGYIYILGPHAEGRSVFRFDYDGLPLGRIPHVDEIGEVPLDLSSIVLDEHDRIYAIDRSGKRICVFSLEGETLRTFELAPQLDPDFRGELTIGALSIYESKLFVPMPSLGSVHVYSIDGRLLQVIGHKGSTMGEMSFPVALAHDSNGILLVLDKHRFNVLGFDDRGRFLGEFGGKGLSPGWFYHPSLLAVDEKDQIYIGQLFENKVQICTIPTFMVESISREESAIRKGGQASTIDEENPQMQSGDQVRAPLQQQTSTQVSISQKSFVSSSGGNS